jgi:hypothetical protein
MQCDWLFQLIFAELIRYLDIMLGVDGFQQDWETSGLKRFGPRSPWAVPLKIMGNRVGLIIIEA